VSIGWNRRRRQPHSVTFARPPQIKRGRRNQFGWLDHDDGDEEVPVKKSVGLIGVTAAAPLVALAIGAPTAWAAPSTGNGATVSINGTTHGSPHSSSSAISFPSTGSQPNRAVAVNGSSATAGIGSGNTAMAVNGSSAQAGIGNNNTATAINGSVAQAGVGNTNTATAINGSFAQAGMGTTNTATAINNSMASAGQGMSDTATAINNSMASAGAGNNNTGTAINNSGAFAEAPMNSTVTTFCGAVQGTTTSGATITIHGNACGK
jgi:hypothetical protein